MSSNRPAERPPLAAPTSPAHKVSILPSSLTGRLVLTSIALVAGVSIVVAVVTTLALRDFLFQRLDDQLAQAVVRFEGVYPADPDDAPAQFCQGPHGPSVRIPGQGPGSLSGFLGGSCPHAEVINQSGYPEIGR